MDTYEKKYNEALERAKELRNTALAYNANHYVKDYETIFPELHESEDERIRKKCIELIKRVIPSGDSQSQESKEILNCIAYLEKQKEQKPISQEDFDTAKHEALWGEQKPTEYLDKDKVYATMKKLHNLSFSQLIPINSDEYKKIDEIICDIRNFLNYPIEPKPAEWSEEDEEKITFLERLIRYNVPEGQYGWVDGHKGGFVTKLEAISMLKSLRPQSKAGLTLLDKNIIDAAVAFVEQNDHFNYWGGIDKHTVLKALRSLRPSWKPSEEQMKALWDAYKGGKEQEPLRELIEQLKKLM